MGSIASKVDRRRLFSRGSFLAMTKPKSIAKKKNTKPKLSDIELEPDAWDRFERTIGKIAPAKHGKAAEKK